MIGHVSRKESESITKTAIHWTAKGRRKGGRPKNTWRRTAESEMRGFNRSWNKIEKLAAKDRQQWKTFVAALHGSRPNNGQ